MRRSTFLLAAATMLLFTACQDAPEADTAEVGEAQTAAPATSQAAATYTLNKEQSTLEWIGTKPTGQHHGTFKLKDGSLMVADNTISGGRFTIDVTSIQPDDQDAENNAKLQKHLKSADFFDAEKYPDATFEITQVQQGAGNNATMRDATHTVTGNLTLKDQTKSVSFPAKVNITDNEVVADANFNIDRTQWGMYYGSDKSLGDKFISPEVNIKLHLVGRK